MGIIEGASNTNRGAWWDGLWFGERPDSPVVAGDLGFDPLGVMPKDPKAADLMRLKELKNGRCPANANVRTHTSTKVSLRGAPACLSRTPRHAGCLRPLYAAPLVSEGMTLCGQRTTTRAGAGGGRRVEADCCLLSFVSEATTQVPGLTHSAEQHHASSSTEAPRNPCCLSAAPSRHITNREGSHIFIRSHVHSLTHMAHPHRLPSPHTTVNALPLA